MNCHLYLTLNQRHETLKERANTFGEVFTPTAVVTDMLTMLNQNIWAEASLCMIEPACGDGAFVVSIITKRIENLIGIGLSRQVAGAWVIGSTWAFDIQLDNVEYCRANALRQILISLGYIDEEAILYNISYIAAIVASIEYQIRVADSLQYNPKLDVVFLSLPAEQQISATKHKHSVLCDLFSGKPRNSWLMQVFCPIGYDEKVSGVILPAPGSIWSLSMTDQLKEMWEDNIPVRVISRRLGITDKSGSTVSRKAESIGLPKRESPIFSFSDD